MHRAQIKYRQISGSKFYVFIFSNQHIEERNECEKFHLCWKRKIFRNWRFATLAEYKTKKNKKKRNFLFAQSNYARGIGL